MVGFKFSQLSLESMQRSVASPEIKKKVVVVNCRPNACRGETRQPGVAARGRRGQQTTRRNLQQTTSGLCIFNVPKGTMKWHPSMPFCFKVLPQNSFKPWPLHLYHPNEVVEYIDSLANFSEDRSWRKFQALPFCLFFFVKGYVQQDVLTSTKMLPIFKLKASNMPVLLIFLMQSIILCDSTKGGFNGL